MAKGLAIALIIFGALTVLAMVTFGCLGVWFNDSRWGGLASVFLFPSLGSLTGGILWRVAQEDY